MSDLTIALVFAGCTVAGSASIIYLIRSYLVLYAKFKTVERIMVEGVTLLKLAKTALEAEKEAQRLLGMEFSETERTYYITTPDGEGKIPLRDVWSYQR